MEVQIVSYILKLNTYDKVVTTAEIINNSKSDLIVFPGNTIATIGDAYELINMVMKSFTALF